MSTTSLEVMTDHSRRRFSYLLATVLIAATVVMGTSRGASSQDAPTTTKAPTSAADAACADPESWAADNGADVVNVNSRWNVAFLVFGGPYAVIGSDADDFIVGSRRADLICGNGGDDRILSGRGNDLVDAGDGNDRVWSGSGADIVDGGPGADSVRAGRGIDACANDPSDRLRSCEVLIDPTPPPTTTTTPSSTTSTTLTTVPPPPTTTTTVFTTVPPPPTTTTTVFTTVPPPPTTTTTVFTTVPPPPTTTTTVPSTTTLPPPPPPTTTTTSVPTSTTSTTVPPAIPQARVRVFTQGPVFPSPPPQVLPTIDCVRPRGGQMEAVIGHTTADEFSRNGRWEVFDFDGNEIDYDAVPDFFLAGSHRSTFAVPYDPAAPLMLRLSVGDGIYARQAEVFLGAGPDTCAANVADVIPIYVGGGIGQPTFLAVRDFFTGTPISISVTAQQSGTTVCTGAESFPAAPRVVWGFQENSGFVPIPAGDRIGLVDSRFVQTLNPGLQVASPGLNLDVSINVIADVTPRCQLAGAPDSIDGRVNYLVFERPPFIRVEVDATAAIDVSLNDFQGGFRRFR